MRATKGESAPGAERRRVVHVTTVPQTLLFLSGQAEHLRDRGFDAFAISSPGPELERFADSERVECFPIPMERRVTPLRDLVALVRLVWRMRALRPDVVDAHTPKAGLLGMIAAALAGVPVRVYHLHGLPFVTARGARRRILRATERVAAALATRVLCVSRSVAEVAVSEGVARREKISVLLGGSIAGVDAHGRFGGAARPSERRAARSALGIPPDARVVGFVGRLVRDKGLVELARAWASLREEMPDAWLLLVGPFEPRDRIPDEVAWALRTDPRVHLAGLDWDVPKYFRAMDVLALPSYREGFPVVPLEAAAMGLPVVATTVPGCVDAVVDGVTGTLVPPRDVHALADALRAYLADPALRETHGAAGRERVLRDYEPGRMWDALLAEYVALLARTPPRRESRAAAPASTLEGR